MKSAIRTLEQALVLYKKKVKSLTSLQLSPPQYMLDEITEHEQAIKILESNLKRLKEK